MRFFACVVGANCNSPYAVACVFSSNRSHCKFAHIFNCPHVGGRIAHILRCASSRTLPLHVCFLDVRKYVNTQKTSWAWYEYVCARCRGELQFALVVNCPYRGLCFQALKIVKINTINKIKSINSKKFFIFAL